ncbi:hypothetical protein [Streptomyces swartbergensis]|uniref:hypothetical protein n=1 Tax=Streptomyces swartbergensis TaxID=487165 RepID=UPI00117DC318|nr:hypothetical protein [Streptomyces swartbergensis]
MAVTAAVRRPQSYTDAPARLEPTVLIAADGYLFKGTAHDRREAALELAQAPPGRSRLPEE